MQICRRNIKWQDDPQLLHNVVSSAIFEYSGQSCIMNVIIDKPSGFVLAIIREEYT